MEEEEIEEEVEAPQQEQARPPLLRAPPSNPAVAAVSGTSSPRSPHSPSSWNKYPERTPSPGAARVQIIRTESGGGRISSPFELSSPRMWTSPPSPMTVDTVPDQPTLPTPPAVPEPSEDM